MQIRDGWIVPDISHSIQIQVYGFTGNSIQPRWTCIQSFYKNDSRDELRTFEDLLVLAKARAILFRDFHKQVRIVEYRKTITGTENVIEG